MATVTTPPTQPWNRDDSQRRVEHPLQSLRRYIRSYVSAEGLLLVALYLALWFWISLALDFGFFKVLDIDFVQELPVGFRGVVLGLLVTGLLALVTLKMLFRLLKEFHNGALALVLERRFPAELGDRLITAVELADTHIAEQYGFSQPMIDQTIRDAADRVGKLPVAGVFDWRRLRLVYAVRAVVLTVGIYLLVGVAYVSLAHARAVGFGARVEDYAIRFNNVAGIWFERNILLSNTIWPRRAHLELVNFPESGDKRVGRDAPPPGLRVRAWKWVVPDLGAPEGWRSMKWPDVTPEILGRNLDTAILPAAWKNWTVDEIELHMAKAEAHATLDANTRIALDDVFSQLHARAESPRMTRRFRELVIPQEVIVYYKGATVKSEQTLKKQPDNEYAGILSDLKESVRFTAKGEDYYTPYQQITIVPPPSLVALLVDEEQPAYLYHRPPAGNEPIYLKGKKQLFADRPASLSGNATRITVPSGTNVMLKGTVDKGLRARDGLSLVAREASAPLNFAIEPDEQSPELFKIRFNNVNATLDFIIEMVDPYDVKGYRHIVIKPDEDTPPELDLQVEVIRKTPQGYMVTPTAKIPFSGRVRDDHGLNQVDFLYTLASLESQTAIGGTRIASIMQLTPQMNGASLLAPPYLSLLGQLTRLAMEDPNKQPERTPLGLFAKRIRELAANDVLVEEFEKRLREAPPGDLVRDVLLDPLDLKDCAFDVDKLGLKVADEKKLQPHYRLRLWMMAVDNNVETGPGIGDSKEKYVFLIVSEYELLIEIGKEEETLHFKLEDTVNKLKDAQAKLEQVKEEIPGLKPTEFSPTAVRVEELLDSLTRGLDVSREVYMDYSKILRELQVNVVRQQFIDRVKSGICDPLNDAVNQEFDHSDKSLRALLKNLQEQKKDAASAETAVNDMKELIKRLETVLDAMGEVITLNKLIEQLTILMKAEIAASEQFKKEFEKKKEQIINDVFKDKPKDDKKPNDEKKPETEKKPEQKKSEAEKKKP